MFSRDDFLQSVSHMINVCKHLQTKLPEGSDDYRLCDSMRSNVELLRYLSWCASGPIDALIHGDWGVIQRYQEAAATMTAAEFPEHMDRQLARVHELLEPLTDEDLRTRDATLPWGATVKLGKALVDTSIAFLSAYRFQLFCHAKTGGASELTTMNAWLGTDKPEEIAG